MGMCAPVTIKIKDDFGTDWNKKNKTNIPHPWDEQHPWVNPDSDFTHLNR